MISSDSLESQIEPFDSFWEGPEDIEKGFNKFHLFYKNNYLKHFPTDKSSAILVVSCGPGYCLNTLSKDGYTNIKGIDSRQCQIDWTKKQGFNGEVARAFEYVTALADNSLDAIFCEQEINHLNKKEMLTFFKLCLSKLTPGGRLICHSLNGANPVVGAESLAQNFDHCNTFTEYTMRQALNYTGFENIQVFPLNLYVFWKNPANYLLLAASGLLHLSFRALFIMYGKSNKLFTKKIGASCQKPS